jgi:hypothetical protein
VERRDFLLFNVERRTGMMESDDYCGRPGLLSAAPISPMPHRQGAIRGQNHGTATMAGRRASCWSDCNNPIGVFQVAATATMAGCLPICPRNIS